MTGGAGGCCKYVIALIGALISLMLALSVLVDENCMRSLLTVEQLGGFLGSTMSSTLVNDKDAEIEKFKLERFEHEQTKNQLKETKEELDLKHQELEALSRRYDQLVKDNSVRQKVEQLIKENLVAVGLVEENALL